MKRQPRNPRTDKLVNERLISMAYGQIGEGRGAWLRAALQRHRKPPAGPTGWKWCGQPENDLRAGQEPQPCPSPPPAAGNYVCRALQVQTSCPGISQQAETAFWWSEAWGSSFLNPGFKWGPLGLCSIPVAGSGSRALKIFMQDRPLPKASGPGSHPRSSPLGPPEESCRE